MSTLYQNYITGDDAENHFDNNTQKFAQSFTVATAHRITSVKLKLYRTGSPGTLVVGVYHIVGPGTEYYPGGASLCSGTYDGDTLGTDTNGTWVEITLGAGHNLAVGSVYAIQIECPGADASNTIHWRFDDSTPTYSGGRKNHYTGSAWAHTASDDMMFEEWGDPLIINESAYNKTLVAISNNEVWYEITPGTMVELAAANGNIDTSEPLKAVEAYQKIFIVNKTNLKVIDFINTKINTADAGANPCHKGNTLTGGTSAAEMIVDYVDAVTDDVAMNVYGHLTTTIGFENGETVTGTNDDSNAISFVLSADGVYPPHWYNWTVFGNDTTTYGTMPTSCSLIAIYRGRVVINDILRPHAWYMFKVGDPWKILYDYTNDGDLSAVVHTNTTVGVVGDIITAFIPYKDDLFIFGCANSIWILVGDPLGSGQLARITKTTGVWGARAWCIDDKSNLYFFGEDGIYRMPITESYSPPENISKLVLPNLVADLDLDKGLHRLVLEFDPINYGIVVSKTTLSDGSSTNYWFSLLTQGFYPETYPNSCGVFSAYYYSAIDDTYKKFLVACNDGYIREFDNSTKNDTTTSSTSAIDSYFAIVNQLSEDENIKGKLTWVNAITAGGASGGAFDDTDSVSYSLFTASDAETCLEDIKDGATAFTTGTWSDTGKQTKNRTRMRGHWFGLKLRNSIASETWAIDKIYSEIKPAGRE